MNTQLVDETVKIPAAVRAAAERAAKFYEQPETEPAEKPEETAANGNEEAKSEETPANTAPENFETPAPTAQEITSEPTDEAKTVDWERRFNAMKGRYDRAEQQTRQLAEQIQSLQQIIAQLEATKAPAARESEIKLEKLITPEEENDYGQDFLKVVGKKAKEELLPEIRKYEDKIAELEAKLAGVNGYVAQDARGRMLSVLDEKLPNWREVNRDDNFISWLQLPDLYSGDIRHSLLKAAYERNDANRVLAFFTGFLAEEAAMSPAEARTEETRAPAPVLDPKSLAAPGRAKSAAASSAPAEKPIFTRAQIAKFYADAAAGKFRGKEAERDRLEMQIFEAEREGRIRS